MALAEAAGAGQSEFGQGRRKAGVARLLLGELALLVLAVVAESGLLLAAQQRGLPVAALLTGHVLICSLLFHLAMRRARAGENTIPALLAALLTLVAGPAGSAMALIGLLMGGRTRPRPELLEEWYDRIALTQKPDPTQQLCDSVAIGRALDLTGPAPRSFVDIVARGTIAERQAALGLIARHFGPEYAPALRVALKSEEPVIRVQAAAVAARVRERLERSLAELFRRADSSTLAPAQAMEIVAEIGAAVSSGLLDESTAARADRVAARLQGGLLSAAGTGLIDVAMVLAGHGRRGGPSAVRRMTSALETEMIRAGEYARLRGLRRVACVVARGGLRVRPRLPVAARKERGAAP